jgi:hypothetical protein
MLPSRRSMVAVARTTLIKKRRQMGLGPELNTSYRHLPRNRSCAMARDSRQQAWRCGGQQIWRLLYSTLISIRYYRGIGTLMPLFAIFLPYFL